MINKSYAVAFFIVSVQAMIISARATLNLGPEDYMKYSKAVMDGGRLGLRECQRQFQNQPWNCEVSENNLFPIFTKKRLPLANKETAFVHAITMAGAMYNVIKKCNSGELKNCKCLNRGSHKKVRDNSGQSKWEGCKNSLIYGDLVARHFVDALEGPKKSDTDGRRSMNLHNNKVGRKVIRSTSRKICKCHGSSSACPYKTCMRKLAPFSEIGNVLMKKFKKTLRVQFKNKDLYDDKGRKMTKKKGRLVYFDESPDYCKANEKLNIPGVEGRVCTTGKNVSLKECEKLCKSCGLKVKREVVMKEDARCNCKFVWCCKIVCQKCTKKLIKVTCVRS